MQEQWEITWAETLVRHEAERIAAPPLIALAEAKYAKAYAEHQAWRTKAHRHLKAANRKILRLNPMGDLGQMSTADKRTLVDTEARRDNIVSELRGAHVPIRAHFVAAELLCTAWASGQYEHMNSVKQALIDGLSVPDAVANEYSALFAPAT